MARSERKICVLQVDRHFLHAVRFENGADGLRVLSEHTQPGTWSQEDGSLAAALGQFASAHALAQDDVYTVLPRHEIASRFLVFPTHDEEELAGMVRFSAAEYVPFPEHELHIGQCFLSKEANGDGRALAVYAQKEAINRHLALLKGAGLSPAGIFLSTCCLAAAMDIAPPTEERYALVNLSSGGIEVVVFDKSHPYYGRAVAHDWESTPELGEAHLQELALELRGSLSAYRRETEHGEPAETVYFSSDVLDPTGLCDALGLETAKECRPATAAGRIARGAENLTNPAQLAALGAARLAAGHPAYHINLLPDELRRVHLLRGLQETASRLGVYAAALVVLLVALFAQAVYQRGSMIRELEKQAAGIAPMAEGVASKQRQLGILRQQVEGSGNVMQAMWTVTEAVPPGKLTIVQFSYDKTTGVDVFGQALSLDAVAQFAAQLRNSAQGQLNYFRNAKSMYENRGKLFNEDVYNFHITIPMKVDDAS